MDSLGNEELNRLNVPYRASSLTIKDMLIFANRFDPVRYQINEEEIEKFDREQRERYEQGLSVRGTLTQLRGALHYQARRYSQEEGFSFDSFSSPTNLRLIWMQALVEAIYKKI